MAGKRAALILFTYVCVCVLDYLCKYTLINSFIYSKAPDQGLNLGHGSQSAKS